MSNKNEATNGVIEGVLVYTKIAQADKKYESEELEYSIGVLVTEDEADEWVEQFKKQPPKPYKVSEFKTKFKIDVPEKFEGEKKVYQITLKKSAEGDERFRPRVFLETEEERIDITESRLVANGSVGKVSYRAISNKYGSFAYLSNVLIQEEDFIEYESTFQEAGSEFGGKKPVKKEEAKDSATKARKPKQTEKNEDEGQESGDEFGGKKETKKPAAKKESKPASKRATIEKDEPKEAKEDKAPWDEGDEGDDVPY